MSFRTVEDLLRAEYFDLLPRIRLTTEEIEAEVRHLLIPILRNLESHERIVVRSRVKDCESAIGALLRRRPEYDASHEVSAAEGLITLKDLAGVRILAFPKRRVIEIDEVLRSRFGHWAPDPVPPVPGTANSLALKYHGFCQCSGVCAEIQLLSLLTGLFWEIEHAALYKPSERLRELQISERMQTHYAEVIRTLSSFEQEFEAIATRKSPGTEGD
jgi:ppGpp synthetase/RelA/SpoT-type nucleotidyltranferase